jgi:hypothetical protein
MNLERAYRTLLHLYPNDFQQRFESEMLKTFAQAASERRLQARSAFMRFLLLEFVGLLCGAAAEWFATLFGSGSARRRFPGELEFAATGVSVVHPCLPGEVLEAQERIALLIQRMVHAIANHDFSSARSYSYEERAARLELRRLWEKHNIDDPENSR